LGLRQGQAHIRKDTPPGLKVATDIMKVGEFKVLSLNAQNSNTINQALLLGLVGLKYQAVPAYRGLKDVETADPAELWTDGQHLAAGWTGSVGGVVTRTAARCGGGPVHSRGARK
jgi:hypothetical protein